MFSRFVMRYLGNKGRSHTLPNGKVHGPEATDWNIASSGDKHAVCTCATQEPFVESKSHTACHVMRNIDLSVETPLLNFI